jgi:hypothetical protein
MNQHLSWEDHVARTTLRFLWPMAHFTPTETRCRLIVPLIVPQFLYCDVIFAKSSARLRELLKITFNACAKYIYGISSPMKRLKFSMSVLISQSAVCSDPCSDIQLAFCFWRGEMWLVLLLLALQTTFNGHYFFYVVLELVTNSFPYTAAMMIIIVKDTIKSFTFFFCV